MVVLGGGYMVSRAAVGIEGLFQRLLCHCRVLGCGLFMFPWGLSLLLP